MPPRSAVVDTKVVMTRAKGSPKPSADGLTLRAIRVLVVDDHPMWRETLCKHIERSGATIVAAAGDGEEAARISLRERPDVVVMDVQLPTANGIETTAQIIKDSPSTRVLMLSSSDDRDTVLQAVRAGASGYLVKSIEPSEIVKAITSVHEGRMVFPPSLARVVLDELREPHDHDDPLSKLERLTAREQQILGLMAQGLSNQAICAQLHLRVKTVEGYIANILSKLGLEPADDVHRRVLAVLTYLRAR